MLVGLSLLLKQLGFTTSMTMNKDRQLGLSLGPVAHAPRNREAITIDHIPNSSNEQIEIEEPINPSAHTVIVEALNEGDGNIVLTSDHNKN